MEKLLSVVIPVYNMEAYLQETLTSLECGERMELMQVVIVNDGSTDASLTIAQSWASRFPGIAWVVDKPNGGHGSAWNAGVALCEGKYIAFLDSDDRAVDIASYLKRLESASADLVFNDKIIFNEVDGKETSERILGIAPGVHSLESEPLPLGRNSCRMVNFHCCIYKSHLLKDICPLFHEKTSYDDMILSTAPVCAAQTYEYSSLPFYRYRIGRGDQSMAPSVISRKIGQQEVERKYAVDYAMARYPREDISGKASSVHEIVRSICVTFYNFVMKLEPERREEYLKSWTGYVGSTVAQPERIVEYRAYLRWPGPVYRLVLKGHHLARRIVRKWKSM